MTVDEKKLAFCLSHYGGCSPQQQAEYFAQAHSHWKAIIIVAYGCPIRISANIHVTRDDAIDRKLLWEAICGLITKLIDTKGREFCNADVANADEGILTLWLSQAASNQPPANSFFAVNPADSTTWANQARVAVQAPEIATFTQKWRAQTIRENLALLTLSKKAEVLYYSTSRAVEAIPYIPVGGTPVGYISGGVADAVLHDGRPRNYNYYFYNALASILQHITGKPVVTYERAIAEGGPLRSIEAEVSITHTNNSIFDRKGELGLQIKTTSY